MAEVLVLDKEGRNFFDDRIPAPDPFVANPFPSPFTAADGTLVLEHLRPGQYRVAARKGAVRSSEADISVVGGDVATVTVTLSDG